MKLARIRTKPRPARGPGGAPFRGRWSSRQARGARLKPPGWATPLAGLGIALGARELVRRWRETDLNGQVALVTGSSRGLGLALARELADEGCSVVLCARDPDELNRARRDLQSRGADVLAVVCDVADRAQVQRLVAEAVERFGRIDVLVNNAGVITVGPMPEQTVDDIREAMDTMFWGVVYPTMEVLPSMRARRSGHVVNVTSIGGKISVPHLVPYGAAKFAAVGFSEGLHAELAGEGIHVLTVVPGLMRTGSHLNAWFKGEHRKEFSWFSLGATLPFTSMSAEQAAREIVAGLKRGESEVILTWQAQLAARIHGLMPGLTSEVLGVVNRLMPGPGGIGIGRARGRQSRTAVSESPVETLGQRAAADLNQL